MTSADTTRPRSPQSFDARLKRLYASISPAGLLVAIGVAAVFSLGHAIGGILTAIRDGDFLDWLGQVGLEFGGHGLMVLVMAACIGPVMSLGPPPGWRRARDLAIALVAAAAVASLVRIWIVGFTDGDMPWPQMLQRLFVRFFVRYGYLATMFVIVVEFYRYEVRSIAAMHGAEVDRLALDREMSAARLQVLQAQIEPHFLFNTLANVRRLYQTRPASGREMLDNLMRYLEVALPRMRDDTSTLDREAVLVEAFLNVQKIRMGRRLTFEIDIPSALRALSVPPMMLLTLVENALKHGLNPLPEGGLVRIDAQVRDDRLLIAVADTGRGFGEDTSGGGTGLANIRARLAAMFGDGASLALSANAPCGVTATISMPIVVADAGRETAA
jgi:signal transduction histidine kinase